jgi:hypothetical protein
MHTSIGLHPFQPVQRDVLRLDGRRRLQLCRPAGLRAQGMHAFEGVTLMGLSVEQLGLRAYFFMFRRLCGDCVWFMTVCICDTIGCAFL